MRSGSDILSRGEPFAGEEGKKTKESKVIGEEKGPRRLRSRYTGQELCLAAEREESSDGGGETGWQYQWPVAPDVWRLCLPGTYLDHPPPWEFHDW